MPTRLLAEVAEEGAEHAVELPFAPVWFGLIAIAVFVGLFALTWSFRSVSTKH